MSARLGAEAVHAPAELLERVAQRDPRALEELVAAHDTDMVRLCYVICGDAELARDATQETWFRLWSRPPRLRDTTRLRSWLLSVAANEARQQLRRSRRRRLREVDATSAPVRRDGLDAETSLDMRAALARLRPAERELIGLRYALGMSSAEIGAHLGISAEGARTRLHRVIQQLRRELAGG